MFSYCENNTVNNSDPSGEFWNIAVGAVIGGVINLGCSYLSAKASGESFSSTDALISFASGAISGALAGTGIKANGQAIVNGMIGLVSSVATDIKNGSSIGKVIGNAAVNTFCGAVGGKFGGDGVKRTCAAAKSAMNAANAALDNMTSKAGKHAARITANRATAAYKNKFFDESMNTLGKFLGITCGSKALTTIGNKFFSIFD